VWDVAADLRDYTPMPLPGDVEVRPARSGEENVLLQFLRREFPGRWRFEFEESIRRRERIFDFMLLITARGVDGFAHLTFENSISGLDRFYMGRLPRPWGQLGPLGVSSDARGRGYGTALVRAALDQLRRQGVRGCVIDWTHLIDFYAKFGFKPYREYAILIKQNLANG
jgi:predicted N-acetyltransferase YhbS